LLSLPTINLQSTGEASLNEKKLIMNESHPTTKMIAKGKAEEEIIRLELEILEVDRKNLLLRLKSAKRHNNWLMQEERKRVNRHAHKAKEVAKQKD
jgi:hypothetical protein